MRRINIEQDNINCSMEIIRMNLKEEIPAKYSVAVSIGDDVWMESTVTANSAADLKKLLRFAAELNNIVADNE